MKRRTNLKWFTKIILISVIASGVFTFASTEVLALAGYIIAFVVLAIFILLGLVFDIIGISVTAAVEAPFHSMAARRERGAVESLRLIKNADKVTSFCNDVVGDVTGIISGTTAALVAARMAEGFRTGEILFPLLISGIVTGVTVGSKAFGKTFAFNNSTMIVFKVGKLIHFLRFKSRKKKKA